MLKGDSIRLSTCKEGMVNSKAYDTLFGWDGMEIKVKMTQGKEGKAKTIEWGPCEKAIGWKVFAKGMSRGKKIRGCVFYKGKNLHWINRHPHEHKLRKKGPRTPTTQGQNMKWKFEIEPLVPHP